MAYVQTQANRISPNGLQSFIDASSDYELAPIGLGSMREQAEKLAEYGRHGDIYVVHAAEGETVVPMEVLEANPQIKTLLFNQMAEMGLDPQRYVVGDQLNSLNPITGIPEFFFKSIFKSIKKVAKKVFKVFKKHAHIIIPLAAAAFGIPFLGAAFPAFAQGTVGASMLGSGIGTLVSGGSIKDAFKSALISGATTGIFKGAQGYLAAGPGQGLTGFAAGAKAALTGHTPVYNAAGALTGYSTAPSTSQVWDNLKGGFTDPAPGSGISKTVDTINPFKPPTSGSFVSPTGDVIPGGIPSDSSLFVPPLAPAAAGNAAAPTITETVGSYAGLNPEQVNRALQYTPAAGPEYGKYLGADALTHAKAAAVKSVQDVAAATGLSPTQIASSSVVQKAALEAAAKVTAESLTPSIVQQWALPVAGGLGITAAAGGFESDDPENPGPGDLAGYVPQQTGADLIKADRKTYMIGSANLDPTYARPDPTQTSVPSPYATQPYATQPYYGHDGGYVDFPRRNGHITGPGGPKDDLVPAMLSNNEFVMTADAVDGAGGPNAMYDLMRNFQMNSRRGVA